MVVERAEEPLVAALWDLLEDWSSTAIQRTREVAATGPSEVLDAEVRMLIDHAAELRGVIEAHLEAAAREPEPDLPVEADPEPAPTIQEAQTVADHTCNSADFERPPCAECATLHWYCSICGAQRDDCRPAAIVR